MKTTKHLSDEAMDRYIMLKGQKVAQTDGVPVDCATYVEFHAENAVHQESVGDRNDLGRAIALAPYGVQAVVVLTEIHVGRGTEIEGDALLAVAVAANQEPSIKVVEYWYLDNGMMFETIKCDDCRELFGDLIKEVTFTLSTMGGHSQWN